MPEHLPAPLADLDQMLIPETHASQFGNPELPIAAFRTQIEDTARAHQSAVLTSATGSGKTTQIPQYLFTMEHRNGALRSPHFETITCTQPRIPAARETAERIGWELARAYGDPDARNLVACITSEDKPKNPYAPIRIVTDGVATGMMLAGELSSGSHAFIGDEVHEWNPRQESNLALVTDLQTRNPDLFVLAMSADMGQPAELAAYLSRRIGRPAALLALAGQTNFTIEDRKKPSLADAVYEALKEPGDILAFVPGKKDILDLSDGVMRRLMNAGQPIPEMLGLHSDLPAHKQRLALARYITNKLVISTDIAQTSLTIPGVTTVVDSGAKRSMELVNGVQVLMLRPATELDVVQRRGRVGRVEQGIYVQAPLTTLGHDEVVKPVPLVPENQRTLLDETALHIALSNGALQPEAYMHTPNARELERSRKRLRRIGAIALDGEATEIGKRLGDFPLSPGHARMVISAEDALRQTPDGQRYQAQRVLVQTIALTSILQNQGIVKRMPGAYSGWRELTRERMSDAIQELEVFVDSYLPKREQWSDADFERLGIISKRRTKAHNMFLNICERLDVDPTLLSAPTHHERRELVRHIITGSGESIFVWDETANAYVQNNVIDFKLPPQSTIRPGMQLVVGHAAGTQRGTSLAGRDINFKVMHGTVVTPGELFSANPHGERVTTKHHDYYIRADGTTIERRRMYYDETAIDHIVEQPLTEPSHNVREFLIKQAFAMNPETQQAYSAHVRSIVDQLWDLQNRTSTPLKIDARLAALQDIARQRSPHHVINFSSLEAELSNLSIHDVIKPALIKEIHEKSPDTIHTYAQDSEEYSEYTITYQGGRAYVRNVTPAQESAVRERLEELGLTNYEITLIKREKAHKAWRKERRNQDNRQSDLPGSSRRLPHWHHRRR